MRTPTHRAAYRQATHAAASGCGYCGLALSVDDPGRYHAICRQEVCEAPANLSSCPDSSPACPACTPEVTP